MTDSYLSPSLTALPNGVAGEYLAFQALSSLYDSTALHAVQYVPRSQTLTVQFVNGSIYRYRTVSKKLYERLIESDSRGEFFNRYIRDSKPWIKIAHREWQLV